MVQAVLTLNKLQCGIQPHFIIIISFINRKLFKRLLKHAVSFAKAIQCMPKRVVKKPMCLCFHKIMFKLQCPKLHPIMLVKCEAGDFI